MGSFDREIIRLALDQHYVITRDQVLKLGSRDQLTRRLKSGFLKRCYDSVYRLAGSEETWRSNLYAACAAGGRYSATSFRALAELHGLPGGDELVEITTRRHNRTQYDDIVTHESRHLDEGDIVYV